MISVIIPVYNGELFIQKCVNSILTQGFSDFEILLIDDGSSDNTRNVCRELSDNCPKVRFYAKTNGGVSSARNYGLEMASGDIVTFVDVDDVVSENYLPSISSAFTDDCDILSFGYSIVTGDTIIPGITKQPKGVFVSDVLTSGCLMGFVFNKAFKRNIVLSARFDEDISIYEDLLFCINVASRNSNLRVKFIDETLYSYIQNSESVMHNKLQNDISRFNAMIRMIELLREDEEHADKVAFDFVWEFGKYRKLTTKNADLKKHFQFLYKKLYSSANLKMKCKLLAIKYLPFLYYFKRSK